MPERVTNPRAHWLIKPKARRTHKQRSFQVFGGDDENVRFQIYLRQNLDDEKDFSCGISNLPRGAQRLILARHNAPSHEHRDIVYRPHIHRASEGAIAAGRKPEDEAAETDRFETADGSLACLIGDFNVSGIKVQHDQPRLEL